MARVSNVPFEKIDSELQTVMHEYDKELGGWNLSKFLLMLPKCSSRSSIFTFRW